MIMFADYNLNLGSYELMYMYSLDTVFPKYLYIHDLQIFYV
jgi:hypothetical protein